MRAFWQLICNVGAGGREGAETTEWSTDRSLTNDYGAWESAGVMYELILYLWKEIVPRVEGREGQGGGGKTQLM